LVQFFQIDPWLIVIVVIGIVAFLAFTIFYGIRAHRRQVSAGREDLIGKVAEVNTVIDPKGSFH